MFIWVKKVFLIIYSVCDVFKQENVAVLINIPQDWEIVWEQFDPRDAHVDDPTLPEAKSERAF